jgi:pimeloyl-ACP methyl ester carboxylesterase
MASFKHEGQRIAYTEYGEGPRAVILVHGLLLNQRMHAPLAAELAQRGNRVITIDLLGHGKSSRPTEMWRYSMSFFAEQVVALMDHLELDEAVVGGTSLGANATLEVASRAPERLRGMVIEMPVLDNSLLACAIAFTPLMIALTFGEPVMRGVQALAKRVPEGSLPLLADIAIGTLRQDPKPSASVLHGLFFGRTAPHRNERRTFEAPTLILGHRRDPVHPFSDADMLADELPHATLVEAGSIIELRIAPERLTNEIADFLDTSWKPRGAKAGAKAPRKAGRRTA